MIFRSSGILFPLVISRRRGFDGDGVDGALSMLGLAENGYGGFGMSLGTNVWRSWNREEQGEG